VSVAEVAGALTIAGVAGTCGSLAYLHAAPTGLSPVRTAVSQYGISPYRAWYRALTICMGVAGAAVAAAIGASRSGSGVATVVVLCGVFAGCRLAISWFPMDRPGTERTTTGAVHAVLALGAFGAAAAAAIRLSRVLDAETELHALATASKLLGWAMVALVALMLLARLTPEIRRAFGAIERAVYAGILTWLVVIAISSVTGHLAGAQSAIAHCAGCRRR
jgi:hypothetical protein